MSLQTFIRTFKVTSLLRMQAAKFGSLPPPIPSHLIVDKSPFEELRVDLDIHATKDKPIVINAYGNDRTIACVCDDMYFLTLQKGPAVKCKCGFWFQLQDANRFWEKPPQQQLETETQTNNQEA